MKQKNFLKTWVILAVALLSSLSLHAQQLTVSGVVSDNLGPVPGASVVVKGTTNGSITDFDGNFSLKNVPSKGTLVISFVGYQTQEIAVNGQTKFEVTLKEDAQMLQEVEIVAVGYGDVKHRDLTGSIGKASMRDLTQVPVNNVAQSLGGRIAGVQVASTDGGLGASFNIVIRGAGSLTQSTAPLYVIDGFPSESSGMSALNPKDIESINVLKDASATAIYGSRGANGVVIITTKSGKKGKPVVSYDGSVTVGMVKNKMELMNGYEFASLQRDIMDETEFADYYLKDGITLDDYKNFKSYDWQDEFYHTAVSHNHYVNLTGGSDKMTYSASLSYSNQQGVVINTDLSRYQGRFNFSQKLNKKVKVMANANYASSIQNGVSPSAQASAMSSALLYSVWGYRPVSPSGSDLLAQLYDEDVDMSNDYRFNPILSARNEYRRTTTNDLSANVGMTWDIIKGLQLKVTGGYTGRDRRYEEFNGSQTRTGNSHPSNTQSKGINARLTEYQTRNYLNENTLSYQLNRKAHSFNALMGLTFQKYSENQYQITQEHITNESFGMAGIGRAEVEPTVASSIAENAMMSYLSRVNYNYDSRYYANFTFRADGSSKFSKQNRWGYFPSGSLAWAFGREKFISNSLRWLSNGKLRASWGLTGNNRIGSYDYMAKLTTSSDVYKYAWDSSLSSGFVLAAMANYDLKWETTEQLDLGLDLGFLNGRINLTLDYYIKTTKDLLLNAEVPASSGYAKATLNVGKLRNKGLEVTLETTNIQTKNFQWTSNFNIAFNRNEIVALNSGQEYMTSYVSWDNTYNNMPAYISKVGESAGRMYGYIYEGTYKYSDFDVTTDATGNTIYTLKPEIPRISDSVQPGDPKYKKLTDDGTNKITDADRTVIGNGHPKHTGGFSNNFTYRGWDLNIFLQWSYGNDVLNANRMVFENSGTKRNLNMFASFTNRWSPENPESNMVRARALDSQYYSSLYVEDGSFLKLKSISLGYTFQKHWLNRYGIKNARVYCSAENIATITGYSGADPEVSVRHSVLTPGFDWSSCPRSFNASFGLNLSF